MRLKTRVLIIIVASLLGLVVMGLLGLYNMRQSMLEERRAQIVQLLDFAESQMRHFHGLEVSGKLSAEEAQAKAKAAIAAQRSPDGSIYYFVRSADDTMIVHPLASRIGKVDDGGKMPDGRTLVQQYRDGLTSSGNNRFVSLALSPRAGHQKLLPKMNGVAKFDPWGWMYGIGFFVDDIDTRFWKQSVMFLAVGGGLLVLLAGLVLRMRSVILQQLGGEPQDAAECMKKIANGDLGVEIILEKDDSTSLMASLKLMQMKLKNITSAIQENASTLDGQVQIFDAAAKTYAETKSEDDLADLLRTIKKLGKTADILGKSVSRFKS
ncbi:Cache domain-containing protein [Formivibrio citricus]|uniref:Cache domain-containing protein n=1 Tax=Formivibrio citricus TaxID=83765 RepID=A0A1I5BTV5_9NEIS|nr:cache domain-containing protein [Formivibrio citricus]SFN78140.1 Cache domain-containing protein [Formivibrio citricus]